MSDPAATTSQQRPPFSSSLPTSQGLATDKSEDLQHTPELEESTKTPPSIESEPEIEEATTTAAEADFSSVTFTPPPSTPPDTPQPPTTPPNKAASGDSGSSVIDSISNDIQPLDFTGIIQDQHHKKQQQGGSQSHYQDNHYRHNHLLGLKMDSIVAASRDDDHQAVAATGADEIKEMTEKEKAAITAAEEPSTNANSGLLSNDVQVATPKDVTTTPASSSGAATATGNTSTTAKKSKSKCKKKKRKLHGKSDSKSDSKSRKKKSSKVVEEEDSSDSDDDSSDQSVDSESTSDSASSSSDSDSDQDSSSEEENKKSKKQKKKAKRKLALKKKKNKSSSKKEKKKKSKKFESSDDESSESEGTESDSGNSERARKPKHRRRTRRSYDDYISTTEGEEEDLDTDAELELEMDQNRQAAEAQAQAQAQAQALAGLQHLRIGRPYRAANAVVPHQGFGLQSQLARNQAYNLLRAKKNRKERSRRADKKSREKERPKKPTKPEFKRVDQLWDSTIHDYKLTETSEDKANEFDEYVFNVRRKFDWEGKYRSTVVDIKSKYLREGLTDIMKDVRAISLVEHQPSIDPNMLFLYLEDMRTYCKKTIKDKIKKEKKRKNRKRLKIVKTHVKLMVSYLDEDYEETKKTLFPMLKAGNITYDLIWALFKPNCIAFTNTYGSSENPRCFKVDYANSEKSFLHGEYYCIEGRYLEYDGKNYGLGDFESTIDHFKGPRKITSLAIYPLQYHKDPEGIKQRLIERGKKFVSLSGMNYKFMKGLAFFKKKKGMIIKVNINGRIMIDPAIFRRINPNYTISTIKPKEDDTFSMGGDESDSCSDCSAGGADDKLHSDEDGGDRPEKVKYKVIYNDDEEPQIIQVPADEEDETTKEKLAKLSDDAENVDPDGEPKTRDFTEEELIIASPVVFGFSFTEKAWLEFSLSGVNDIVWNEGAFESLVLPENQKSIVKALVSSHKFQAAETIDDVIQGKGKGLVFVLHGPPGVGKTLTAEGIAEFLKCPLYAVSAGELGTDARIEHELQKIMDIAHSWGAVLLLDEADVFLEKRQHQDVHRNALVSIFLRLLEYFQGILFLTTNRVETFDDAFQSRIHMPLRYEELSAKAKKEIWRLFIEKVKESGGAIDEFKDKDYTLLARNNLNGRQIKNAVKTAQALSVHEKSMLTMEHIKRVLDVAESFERDLKGGTGYLDAMRSYT